MRSRTALLPLLLLPTLLAAGCSRPAALFVERNARAHVEMLADTIGSRPAGSAANARARAYIVEQLRLFGYDVRVQEADARRPEIGRTARVANVIATLPGPRREAVGLLSHYDSRPESPGGGDDAFGVAVSLEAARVLATQPDRQWTTFVLVTDAEEEHLMGASALMTDPEVRDHLSAYLNLESIGSRGPSVLFEAGPGNAWLVSAWARAAPRPRGGSYATEIYKRLPNDTDFSVLARRQIPGLNFAAIGDGYGYHTSRDTANRLSGRVLRDTGENAVAIVSALQRTDITARSIEDATYFDIGGTVAVSYGTVAWWIVSMLALALGTLAWVRVTRFLIRAEGAGAWIAGAVWTVAGAAVTIAAMVLATWALRASREAYHPWYAAPDRFLLLLASCGGAAAWMMARAGRWIPARARGVRHPAVAWTSALPFWIVLAAAMSWLAPAAAYLWTVPLLVAGVVLLLAPPSSVPASRVASLVVLAASATFWLRDTVDLLRFTVSMFGRQPMVTPVYAYAALAALCGLMIVPPLFATTASVRPLMRPSIATALLLVLIAAFGVGAWRAPAYTEERPLRRYARVIQEPSSPESVWEIGSLEPGLDLGPGAPGGWSRAARPVTSLPLGRLAQPFVFSTAAAPVGPPPVSTVTFSAEPTPVPGGATVMLALVPRETSLSASIVLPPGITPARSSLPGVVRGGRWTATYAAVPQDGLAWHASFNGTSPAQLQAIRVAVTAAGAGADRQRLPQWLPQDRTAWSAFTTWVIDPSAPAPLEAFPALR